MIYFIINLTKYVQDLYIENYKALMKEFKEDLFTIYELFSSIWENEYSAGSGKKLISWTSILCQVLCKALHKLLLFTVTKTLWHRYDYHCCILQEIEAQTIAARDNKNLMIKYYAINNHLSGKYLITWSCYNIK